MEKQSLLLLLVLLTASTSLAQRQVLQASAPASSLRTCSTPGAITGCGLNVNLTQNSATIATVVETTQLIAPGESSENTGYACTGTTCFSESGTFVLKRSNYSEGWLYNNGLFACPARCSGDGPTFSARARYGGSANFHSFWDSGGQQELCNAAYSQGCVVTGFNATAVAPGCNLFCDTVGPALCGVLAQKLTNQSTAAQCVPPPEPASVLSICRQPVTIRQGDTCSSISEANGFTPADLVSANQGFDCNFLQPGQQLCLPTNVVGPPPENARCTTTYKAQESDDCTCISQLTGVSTAELRRMNKDIDEDCSNIKTGEELCVAEARDPAAGCGSHHEVADGETCKSIASDAGIDESTLEELNTGICCPSPRVRQSVCVKSSNQAFTTAVTLFSLALASFATWVVS